MERAKDKAAGVTSLKTLECFCCSAIKFFLSAAQKKFFIKHNISLHLTTKLRAHKRELVDWGKTWSWTIFTPIEQNHGQQADD